MEDVRKTDRAEPAPSLRLPAPTRDQIRRYGGAGPRYTSYPTVPFWTDAFGPAAYESALAACTARSVSLYVHVPFCERLCAFCACNRVITQDHAVAGPYLDRLERELALVSGHLGRATPQVQLALGGGSPNFLRPDELERLVRSVDAHFPPAPGAERSVELDPRRTEAAQLELLLDRGFGRLSFGVQDLDPRVQQAIHRTAAPERLTSLVQCARERGVESINFDLIYGLPEQTVGSFRQTLNRVVALRPDRVALYGYAHVTWISKTQRSFEKKQLPSPEQRLRIFAAAIEQLGAAGYRHLGLDHFALPSDSLARAADDHRLTRNFMGYAVAAGDVLLGFGPSGISELATAYAQSEKDPDAWGAAIDAGRLPTARGVRLGREDLERRWLIRTLLCDGAIPEHGFFEAFGASLRDRLPRLDDNLAPFVSDGLLVRDDESYRVTETGRLFLRPIAMTFDTYLGNADTAPQRFSATL